jgi:hypothetical protein
MSNTGKYILILIVAFSLFSCFFTGLVGLGQGFAEGGGTVRIASHDHNVETGNDSVVIFGNDNVVTTTKTEPPDKANPLVVVGFFMVVFFVVYLALRKIGFFVYGGHYLSDGSTYV